MHRKQAATASAKASATPFLHDLAAGQCLAHEWPESEPNRTSQEISVHRIWPSISVSSTFSTKAPLNVSWTVYLHG